MTAASSAIAVTRKGPDLFGASAPRMSLLDLPVRIDPEGGEWIEADGYGGWLGYGRARAVRDLADRLLVAEILSDSDICRTVRQNAGKRGRPTNELWFNRRAALIVAAKAETKRSAEVLHWMVDVILAVRDAMFPSVPAERLRVAEAKATRLEGRVAEQDRAVAGGTIGPAGSKAIRRRISTITTTATGLTSGREYNRVWGQYLRDLTLIARVPRSLAQLPLGQRADVFGALDDFERRARRVGADRGRAMQLSLDLH
ncbi:MAG: hypothetical protein JWM10_4102 [Myxococcaceae bacterium]|nr:hypothetical protein [Myxococcaceae bacterium]